MEEERTAAGAVEPVVVAFLTNSECPFRCTFCDLWVHTLPGPTPPGAVATQVEAVARDHPAGGAPHVKLYNSGNFFDRRAIPDADVPRIAAALRGRATVVVETHPRLGVLDGRAARLNDALGGGLEVAMGLETADADLLATFDKAMTADDFAAAARRLGRDGIAARAFILVRPPGHDEEQGATWARRSLDLAQDAGAGCCVLIPFRGASPPPSLDALEAAARHGVARGAGRVFVDLWDAPRLYAAAPDAPARLAALARLNHTQAWP